MDYIFDYQKNTKNSDITNDTSNEFVFDYMKPKINEEDSVDRILSNVDEYDTDSDVYNKLRQIEKTSKIESERKKAKAEADKRESNVVSSGLLGLPQGLARIGKGFAGLANIPADISESLGYDVLPRVSSEKFDDIINEYEPAIDEGDYIKRTSNIIGQAAPLMAGGVATGYGLAGMGVAEGTAALGGAIATGVPMGGAAKEESLKTLKKDDPYRMSKAYGVGITESLLESAGNLLPIARVFNKIPALKSRLGNILVGIAEGSLGEGVEEYLQGLAKPYIEKGELSQKDWDDAWTSAKYGAASGGVIGGVIGSISKIPDTPIEPVLIPEKKKEINTVENTGYKDDRMNQIFNVDAPLLSDIKSAENIENDKINNFYKWYNENIGKDIKYSQYNPEETITLEEEPKFINSGKPLSQDTLDRIRGGNTQPIDITQVETTQAETTKPISLNSTVFDNKVVDMIENTPEFFKNSDLYRRFTTHLSDKLTQIKDENMPDIDKENLLINMNNDIDIFNRLVDEYDFNDTDTNEDTNLKILRFEDAFNKEASNDNDTDTPIEPLSKDTKVEGIEKVFDNRYSDTEIDNLEGKNFTDIKNELETELEGVGILPAVKGKVIAVDENSLPILSSDERLITGSLRDDNDVTSSGFLGRTKTGKTIYGNVTFKDGKYVNSKGEVIDSTGLTFYDKNGKKIKPLSIEAGTVPGTQESYLNDPANVEGIIHESIHRILNSDEKFKKLSISDKEKIVMGAIKHYFIEENPLITDKLGKYDGIIKKFVKGVVKQNKDMIPRIISRQPKGFIQSIIDPVKEFFTMKNMNNMYNDYVDDSGKAINIIDTLTKIGLNKLKFNNDADRQAFIDNINKYEIENNINTISRSEGAVENKINNSKIPEFIAQLKETGMDENQISELFMDSLNVLSRNDKIDNLGFDTNKIDLRSFNKYKKFIDKLPTESRFRSPVEVIIALGKGIQQQLNDSGLMKSGNMPIQPQHVLFSLLNFDDSGIDSVSKMINTVKKGRKNKKLSSDIKNPLINVINGLVQVEKNVNKNNFIKSFIKSIEFIKDSGVDTGNFIRKISPDSDVKNKISFFEDGKENTYWMSKDVQDAFESMYYLNEGNYIKNKQQIGGIMSGVLNIASMVRSLVTKTPAFGVRNFARDLQSQLIMSTGQGMTGQSAQIKDELGSRDDIKGILEANGIIGDRSYVSSKQDFYKSQTDKAEDIVKGKNIILSPDDNIGTKILNKYLNSIDSFNDKSEAFGRTNEFKRSYLLARNKLGMNKDSAIKYAIDRTQEIMNFQKSGANVRYIGSMIPFMNANIQGLRKLSVPIINAMKMINKNNNLSTIEKEEATQRIKNIGKAGLIYASLTLSLEAMKNVTGGDDLSDDILNSYWQIPMGKGNNILVPKGFEDAVISNLFRNSFDLVAGNETGFGKTASKFSSGLIPPMTTPIFSYSSDLYDIWFNGIKKNYFSGKTSAITKDKMASDYDKIADRSWESLQKVGGSWTRMGTSIYDVFTDYKKSDVPYGQFEKILRTISDISGMRTADYRSSLKNISVLGDMKDEITFEIDVLKNYNKSYNKLSKSVTNYKNKYYKNKTPENKQKVMDSIQRLNKFAGKFINAINKYGDRNKEVYNRTNK